MAEDTRKSDNAPSNEASVDDESTPRRKKSKHDFPKTQAGKMWEAFGNPAEPVNEMPGGTYNSAGGKPKEITWKAIFDWKLSDARRFYRVPCARDALLVGVGGGAAVGGVTAIIGGKMASMLGNSSPSLTTDTRSQTHKKSSKSCCCGLRGYGDGAVRMVRVEKERGVKRNRVGSDWDEKVARQGATREGGRRGQAGRCEG
jgi:hypothetical protein